MSKIDEADFGNSELRIRPMNQSDCTSLSDFTAQLAEFEKMGHLNHMTPQRVFNDKYVRCPSLFEALIAEVKSSEDFDWVVVGSAIYIVGFSLRSVEL